MARARPGAAGGERLRRRISHSLGRRDHLRANHGLPVPFDSNGWASMLDAIGVYQFFDGVINSLDNEN